MSEADFLSAICDESDCNLLLDVSNIVVNSVNQNQSPADFLNRLPVDRYKSTILWFLGTTRVSP